MTIAPIESSSLVSVVVPCYNAAPYVGETIESVLSQTYPAVELIVVDDRSTDGSWEVVQRYSERLTAIRLPENRGGSHARNRGAERARGEFLMFLDADDLIAPDTLAALVEAIREKPDGIGACPWKRLVLQEGEWKKVPGEVPLPTAEEDHLAGWLEGRWVPTCSILWCREHFERTGGWDESLSGDDDADLMMRALAEGARLVITDRGESYYRSHPPSRTSVSGNLASAANLRSRMGVLEKLTGRLEQTGRLETYKKSVGVAYYRMVPLAWAGHPQIAEECVRRGKAFAGRQAVSSSFVGKVVSWVFGAAGKERIIAALGRVGIASRTRRKIASLQKQRPGAAGRGAESTGK